MADLDFEDRLDSLFEAAPAFADNDRFAERIQARLRRRAMSRRLLLSVSGLSGAFVAGVSLLSSDLPQRWAGAIEAAREVGARLAGEASATSALVQAVGSTGWAGWGVLGLGALACIFAASRHESA